MGNAYRVLSAIREFELLWEARVAITASSVFRVAQFWVVVVRVLDAIGAYPLVNGIVPAILVADAVDAGFVWDVNRIALAEIDSVGSVLLVNSAANAAYVRAAILVVQFSVQLAKRAQIIVKPKMSIAKNLWIAVQTRLDLDARLSLSKNIP